jgi:hypothetical protein
MYRKQSMKLNWLRIKYQLLALVNPLCWFTSRADRAWDKELWDALVRGDIAVVGRFHAGIGDKCVWIENHPYASGTVESPSSGKTCTRATALYLADCLPAARIMQRLKGIGPDFEILYTWNGHIIT